MRAIRPVALGPANDTSLRGSLTRAADEFFERFENDDAAGLVEEVIGTSDLSGVTQALDGVLESPDYLEAPVASKGLAAADIVAELRGHAGRSAPFTEELDKWIKKTKLSPDAKTAETRRDRPRPQRTLRTARPLVGG